MYKNVELCSDMSLKLCYWHLNNDWSEFLVTAQVETDQKFQFLLDVV